MPLAFTVDDLLCDTESLEAEWAKRLGEGTKDEAFWSALKPYGDVEVFANWLRSQSEDFYVLCSRPKALRLNTKAWLKNKCGIVVASPKHLIMDTIPRFDCRLNGIDTLITGDRDVFDSLKLEQVHPIRGYFVDRNSSGLKALVQELQEK